MLQPLRPPPDSGERATGGPLRRHPLVAFFVLAVLSNAAGSVFSILYNDWLIVRHYLAPHPAQVAAFWQTVWVYNLAAYPVCLALVVALLLPVARCWRQLRGGGPVSPGLLARCQRRLVNLPALQVCINFLGWIPGAVVFPLGIGLLGSWENIGAIWWQFAVSFLVSALLTTVQTYFLVEAFLFKYVYPDFFRADRPAAIEGGVFRITFRQRMILYWVAVALVPLTALLVVELNAGPDHAAWLDDLRRLALDVTVVGVISSAVIGAITGRTLLSWLKAHAAATDQLAAGNYDHRIDEKRPGEFGRLTDRFNDMAAELARARLVRDTFGQMVGSEVRDEILERYPGLGGEVVEVTVVFIDIRGFSRRSAGEPPERVVGLLNRFFTLSFLAIERHCGHVNKFLGDGLMALFGVPRTCDDHADRAVAAALDLLAELARLNDDLKREGQGPLVVGIGIHTGPALVGCVGATLGANAGRERTRKEFTAIGETVNLAQRVEQLTKCCGGPLLLSEATRRRLRGAPATDCLGPQELPGFDGGIVVHRVLEKETVMTAPRICRLVTLGCKVNQYETQYAREMLEANGYREAADGEPADLCLVNTCTVTHEADAKGRQAIRRLAGANPGAAIVVMGCFATRDPQTVARLPGVVKVVTDKERLAEELRDFGVSVVPAGITRFDGHQRAFVKVQDGCLLNCTYCIIPHVRPTLRSRPPEEIVAEVRGLVERGWQEVVLTGVHLGHYGIDLSRGRPRERWHRLWHLLERLADLPGDFRIRLSSLEAAEVRDDLVRVLAGHPRICPHLHLCLQSGSDRILAAMKRRYRSAGFLERYRRLRAALDEPAFTTDVIVGFPGETEADFDATCCVVREVGFCKVHVFSYSPRQGTVAVGLPGAVPAAVVASRRERLLELEAETMSAYHRRLIGRRLDVLVEGADPRRPGWARGTSCRYAPVAFPGHAPALLAQRVPVRGVAVADGAVLGHPEPEATSGRVALPLVV